MNINESQEAADDSWISINISKVMIGLAIFAFVIIAIVYFVYFRNFSGSVSLKHDVWGTFGDFIGGVLNPILSFVAFIALLLTIVLQSHELKFTRYELRLSRETQQKSKESIEAQVIMMKDSATLSALGNIYTHYSESYGENDETNILKNVAAGHRSWAVRESFSIIDNTFEVNRDSLVSDEFLQLIDLLSNPRGEVCYLNRIAWLVGSLIVDRRLAPNKRKALWPLYEFVRKPSTLSQSEESFQELKKIASRIVGRNNV